MASRPTCKFWLQGQCKFGDNCKFEHSRNTGNRSDNNRFAPLNDSRNYGNSNPRSQSNDPRDRSRQQQQHSGQERYIDKDQLRKDLSNERPIWYLSCYTPQSDMPKNLFGGPERELSPEEMRFRFYELASQGKIQDAVNEADSLQRNATNQMENALRDLSGAIRYLQNGYNEHPNRTDICEECTRTGTFLTKDSNQQSNSSNVSASFGQPSGNVMSSVSNQFPQASAFGQPSMPTTNSAFGFQSKLGPNTAFGQSGSLQAPPQSAFGRPSMPGAAQTAFGQPSGLGARASPFGQPSQPAANPFSQPSNPFQQQQQSSQLSTNPNPFATQPINQVSMQMSPITNQSSFGMPSGSSITSSSFQQARNGFSTASSTGFGQVSSNTSDFGRASSGGFASSSGTQGFSAPAQSSTNGTGTPAVRGVQGKLQSWKGRQVQYFDNEPCYREDDGFWQRIWLPDGTPAWNKPEILPTDLPYDIETEERYKQASSVDQFSYGLIPLIPPKREWTDWNL